MAEAVYALCAITSIVCAFLLYRGYRHHGARLLFWAAISFTGLALNNTLLFIDLVIVPTVDLTFMRGGVSLAAMMILLFGLVWESH